MNRGAWQATVQGVAKSQTPLSDEAHTSHYQKDKNITSVVEDVEKTEP